MSESASYTRWTRVRIILFCGLLFLLFGVVVARAHKLQSEEGPWLREMAEQQYLRKMELPPRRGDIQDRHGTPLALSVMVPSIYANPRMVGSKAAAVSRQLAGVLGMDASRLQRKLSSRRYFAWIKRRISPREAHQVKLLKIRGIFLTDEPRRFYPNHWLGGSVVGFSGLDGRGLEGVELSQDSWLRGSPIRIASLHDAMGRAVFSEGEQQPPTTGNNVQLALDKYLQYEVEQALADVAPDLRPRSGWAGVVVLEPSTGDVLAMSNVPTYDPNRYSKVPPERWRNRALTDLFEPGSTMKIFSVSGGLQSGAVRPAEVFDCEKGAWRVGHYVIHDSHPYTKLDVFGIIKKSSNIGSAKIAFRMGKKGLYEGLSRFGFGRKTGMLLRGERSGVLRQPGTWSDVGLANIAFGQGVSVTMMQLVQALSAVANDGKMMKPRLVLRVQDPRGGVVKEFPSEGTQVLSPEVARTMRRMLAGVTEPGGTAEKAALERYTVAGKTGTAQKVDPVTRTYSRDLWVSSFIGMVPASRPRLIIAVVINEPAGDKYYGGEVAAPVFRRIAEKAMVYLGVKPDRASPPKKKGGDTGARKDDAPAAGEGYVAMERDPAPPLPGEGAPAAAVGSAQVPDFTGMSMAEVLSLARKRGLQVEMTGSGRAVGQSPGPGQAPGGTTCRVSFRPAG